MLKGKSKTNIFLIVALVIIIAIAKIAMMSSSSKNIDIVRNGYLES